MRNKHTAGQSTLEFVVLITVIVAAVMVMSIYVRNAASGSMRSSADRIGQQWDPLQSTFNTATNSTSTRNESRTGDGITATTGIVENTNRNINETINRSTSLFNNP